MDGSLTTVTAPPPWVPRRLLDVDEYLRLTEAGILREDDRVELIEGELVAMEAIGGPHIGTVLNLMHSLVELLGSRARVSVQSSVRLDRRSEPEPDLAVLRPRADRYVGGPPPLAADVLLLIEVAESSLRYDREVKLPLYARHGVPEVWIVDLDGATVELHRGPSAAGYATTRRARRGETIAPEAFPDAAIAITEILG